jgi:hypothetical protein
VDNDVEEGGESEVEAVPAEYGVERVDKLGENALLPVGPGSASVFSKQVRGLGKMQKKVRQRGWWKTVSKRLKTVSKGLTGGLTGRRKMQRRARMLSQNWRVVQWTTG